jgi:ABC-type oligopeptide transport system ATPase subunit
MWGFARQRRQSFQEAAVAIDRQELIESVDRESDAVTAVFANPRHAYTKALLDAARYR